MNKPLLIEKTSRTVIENKLLTALEDKGTVAILASEQDLKDIIDCLREQTPHGTSHSVKEFWTRCKNLADGFEQLLKSAFRGFIENIENQTISPTSVKWSGPLPSVAGRMEMTHQDFQRACAVALRDLQENPNCDTHLVHLLCEAVRCSRECCDLAKMPLYVVDEYLNFPEHARLTIQPRDPEDEPSPSNQASSRAASPSPGMEQSNHIPTANHRGVYSASTPGHKSGISRNP